MLKSTSLRYQVGSLTAIGEIMLLLWVTSLLAGMGTQIQLSEEPFPDVPGDPAPATECDYVVVVGPGSQLRLNEKLETIDEVIGVLRGQPEVQVELRAAHNVDADFFFTCRYRLREAGIGYVERRPEGLGKSDSQPEA